MVQSENDSDYQDPILTPGNLRKLVQSLPGKSKSNPIDYDYHNDNNSFEREINEFFNYTEVSVQLQEYQRLYDKEFKHNPNSTKDTIMSLLDRLESSDQELRVQACKHLVHISINSIKSRENNIAQNNNILLSCNCFHIFYQKLQSSCLEYQDTNGNRLGICTEIDLYLTLTYILMEIQRLQYTGSSSSKKFKEELISYELNLTEILFSTIAKTRDKIDPTFPIKKAILLLWKSLLFTADGLESVKSTKQKLSKSLGLDHRTDILTKSTPQELLSFQNETNLKYPGFVLPKFPFPATPLLTFTATNSLSKAMGYAKATENVELLYYILFPPKSTQVGSVRKHYLLQDYYANQNNSPLPLPLCHTGLDVPKSIKEAGDTFISNMHVSLANFQILQERSKAINKWQNQHQQTPNKPHEDGNIKLIDKIYANILPHFQSFIVVILKLLLASVAQEAAVTNNGKITLEYLEQVDAIRNKEIISKAISDVLKFEYISQLLVDSGFLLLTLKMIGLQELSELVKTQTDISYYGVFDYNRNRVANQPKSTEFVNTRSMYWSITLLRVLQMLTKHKTHRIMLMARYKSAAILKRLLKIHHPVLERYVLKLIKSQVPYLGKKWRSHNMRTISAIYLNCKTILKDDWVSKPDSDESEEEESKLHEKNLRVLIQLYHHENYNLALPLHDEISLGTGPGFTGFIQYDLGKTFDSDEFDFEVCGDNGINYGYDVTPAPSTPNPDVAPPNLKPEELCKQLNKIYMSELDSEFSAVSDQKTQERSDMVFEKEKDMADVYDEIVGRLLAVEEKAVEQWLDQRGGIDNQYYYKMLQE